MGLMPSPEALWLQLSGSDSHEKAGRLGRNGEVGGFPSCPASRHTDLHPFPPCVAHRVSPVLHTEV